ncbi:MAG: acyl-CoA dehydrogenase family protein [Chloroflexi bacterium]|nr:acyl-CoA dehydrogenase family protein [Chloroflexota bacterium]
MLDFSFTPEQDLFRQTVRDFARRELAPNSATWDRAAAFPPELPRKMAALGLLGLRTPAAYGGVEADAVTAGIAAEELARGDFSASYFILLSALLGEILTRRGTPEQQAEWLSPQSSGERLLGLALTEPHCGSDAQALITRAERDGDQYVITGEKTSITFSDVAGAMLVFCKTDPSKGARGITALMVPLDAPGVGRSRFNDLGSRAVGRGALHLDHVRVPVANRIGQEGQGFYAVMQGFDYSRAVIGLMCVGTAQAALDEAIAYAKERTAFGQPLARYEAISFSFAEAATLLEAARLLCYKTLWLRDQEQPHSKEAAMAKWYAPKVAFDVIHQCLLVYGHAGYSDDFRQGQRLRDVIGLEIGDGTAEVSKIIIVREMLGRQFRPYA